MLLQFQFLSQHSQVFNKLYQISFNQFHYQTKLYLKHGHNNNLEKIKKLNKITKLKLLINNID
jgi:hypothetical protein